MAKCLYCEKSGWFLAVDNNGMCSSCSSTHGTRLNDLCRSAINNSRALDRAQTFKTELSQLNALERDLQALVEFEKKGIPTLTTSPLRILRSIEVDKVDSISREVDEHIYQARQRFMDGKTDAAKLNGYEKAIRFIDGLMNEVSDVTDLESKICELRVERASKGIDLAIQKADILVAQGKQSRAKDLLIKGLFDLSHDPVPDEFQAQEFERLKQALVDIGEEAPPQFN